MLTSFLCVSFIPPQLNAGARLQQSKKNIVNEAESMGEKKGKKQIRLIYFKQNKTQLFAKSEDGEGFSNVGVSGHVRCPCLHSGNCFNTGNNSTRESMDVGLKPSLPHSSSLTLGKLIVLV